MAFRYFFSVRWPDHEDDDTNGTLLSDEAAALGYADRVVRELKEGGGYNDPGLMVIVRDGTQRVRALNTLPCGLRLRLFVRISTDLSGHYGPIGRQSVRWGKA